MNIAGYVRVSTKGQVDNGQGLEIQEASIRQWCAENGHTLTGIYSDRGVSGTTELDNRDGLAEAIASVKFNGADAMVVSTIDRLARDLIVQERLLKEIWDSGGQIFTTDEGEVMEDDPDNPSRELIRVVLGGVAQFERKMIALRLRRGRQRKIESGGFGGGKVPYGAKSINGVLHEDETESAILTVMNQMRESGSSYRDIAAQLNNDGVAAKSGGIWYPSTVRTVMMNRVAAMQSHTVEDGNQE